MSLCWNGEKRRKEEIFIEAKDGGRWSKAQGGTFLEIIALRLAVFWCTESSMTNLNRPSFLLPECNN
jgi:hypothetical protein